MLGRSALDVREPLDEPRSLPDDGVYVREPLDVLRSLLDDVDGRLPLELPRLPLEEPLGRYTPSGFTRLPLEEPLVDGRLP